MFFQKNIGLLAVAITSFCIINTVEAAVIGKPPNFLSTGQGLVAWWTFDGTDINWNTGVVADKSGNGNNGNQLFMSTTSSPAEGKIGQALVFDGSDDRINTGSTDLTGATSVSFSGWVYAGSGDFDGTFTTIIDDCNTDCSNVGGFNVLLDDRGGVAQATNGIRVGMDVTTDTECVATTNNVISGSPSWHHLAYTYSPVRGAAIYVNGERRTLASSNKCFLGESFVPDANANLYLGSSNTATNFLKGRLDDIRVYSRELRPDEIWRLYNIGATTKLGKSPATALSSGLVGYWTLDGADINWLTGAVTDRSGQGNTGYVQGLIATSSAPTEGRIGQGLRFDDVNDLINMGAPSSLDITGAVTVSAWIRKDSGFNTNDGIVGKAADGGGHGATLEQYSLYAGSSATRARFRVSNGSATLSSETSPNSILNGVWYHLVGTYDGTATTSIYLDGVLVDSDSTPGFGTLNSIGTFGISQDAYFGGVIDEVRVYNRAVRADEVLKLYELGATTKIGRTPATALSSGLVGYWTLDGADINWLTGAVTDRSGQGNTGYVQGPIATSSAPTEGRIGQALDFDGTNDRVNLGTSLTLSFPFSISVWVKPSGNYSNFRSIFSKRDSFLNSDMVWQFDLEQTNGRVRIYHGTGGNTFSYVPPANQWTHLTVTDNGTSGGVKLYVNGVLNETLSGGNTATALGTDTTAGVYIGDCGCGEWFMGGVDDLRAYNRVLNPDEILQLYNLGR